MKYSIPSSARTIAAFLLVCAAATSGHAGSTDPVLVIGQATTSGGTPARLLDLLGAWGFDDVVQIDYPLSIVVSQGTSFVRYPVGDVPVSGTFAGLADGLTIAEVPSLELAGSTASNASIVHLDLHEMTLGLPPTFTAGPVDVVLYTTLPGEGTFLSNAIEAVESGS